MDKLEFLLTVGGTINWYNHYGKENGALLKKLKIELPCEPILPLLVIYPKTSKLESQIFAYPCSLQERIARGGSNSNVIDKPRRH